MNIKELLNRELSFEEMNELLNELMDYGCNSPEDSVKYFGYLTMKVIYILESI